MLNKASWHQDEVFTMLNITITVFWDVKPYKLVNV